MKEEYLVLSADLPAYGQYPGSRPVEELVKNGFILLDKWPGPTSRDATDIITKLLGAKKSGHTGTLDPKVSGVLPVLLGKACKLADALKDLDKEYVGVMKLHKDASLAAIAAAIKKYTGKIEQLPPKKSAVSRAPRERTIYDFKVLERKGRFILFQVSCEKGTYIRKLCHDIGSEIGGAQMTELRRIRAGPFSESRAVRAEDIAFAMKILEENKKEEIRQFVLPPEEAVEHLGKIILKDGAVWNVANGSPLYTSGISRVQHGIKKGDKIALFTLKGELIALGKAARSTAEMEKYGMAAKPEKILLSKSAYPRIVKTKRKK